jgi:hypothetical protein
VQSDRRLVEVTADLLIIFIALPLLSFCGLLLLVWKLGGRRALRISSAVIAVVCAILLINEATLPSPMGNEAAYVALGVASISLVAAISAFVLLATFVPRNS